MIRCTFLACAAVLAFAVGGCLPAPQPMPPPPPSAPITSSCAAPTIYGLTPGFSPDGYGNCASGQQCAYNPPEAYRTDAPKGAADQIKAAFGIAPPFFKDALCNLDAVYIDTDPDTEKPQAWGMRERLAARADGTPRQVAGISAGELATLAGAPQPYACYEAMTLQGVIQTTPVLTCAPGGPSQPWEDGIVFAADSDTVPGSTQTSRAAVATLGVLAHEVGHIRWFDTIIAPQGAAAHRPQIFTNAATAVTDKFSPLSWKVGLHNHGFRTFGATNTTAFAHYPPTAAGVIKALGGHSPCPACKAAALLDQVYQGQWASFFAAVAPDEDFVETYKLIALAGPKGDGPLKSLTIQIPNPNNPGRPYSEDILLNLTNPLCQGSTSVQCLLFTKAERAKSLLSIK